MNKIGIATTSLFLHQIRVFFSRRKRLSQLSPEPSPAPREGDALLAVKQQPHNCSTLPGSSQPNSSPHTEGADFPDFPLCTALLAAQELLTPTGKGLGEAEETSLGSDETPSISQTLCSDSTCSTCFKGASKLLLPRTHLLEFAGT